MKRLLLIALVCMTMLSIVAIPAAAQTGLADVTLWADNLNVNAGNLTVAVEGDSLTVTFNTIDGWVMNETHLYVGAEAPAKSSPGRFPFKHEELGGVASDTYTVSLTELGIASGATVFVAAQAAIQKPGP